MLERFPRRALDIRVCSDANATAGVVLGLGVDGISTVRNQEAGQPGKLATDFLPLLVLHEISKKSDHRKALE